MIIEIREVTDGFNLELTPETQDEEAVLRAAKIQGGEDVNVDLTWWGDTEAKDPETGEPMHSSGLKIHFVPKRKHPDK